VKLHSCTSYTTVGVDSGDLTGCWPSYASPRTVSNRIDMFSPSLLLELLHLNSRR
jgi:hypothetical protein